jgi:hypothetical protein
MGSYNMKRFICILVATFGLSFGAMAAAQATETAPCVKAVTTATWNGDNSVTASTTGPTCTAQLSSWVISKGHPQKLLDRKIVEVTSQTQTFSVLAPKCGPYQIDLRTEKLPKGHYITGGKAKGNSCEPVVVKPKPPVVHHHHHKVTHHKTPVASPKPELPRTGAFGVKEYLSLGLLLPFLGAGLKRLGRERV